MKRKYSIKLDDKFIGYTFLKGNDVPMGCVMGKIYFENIESGYEFFSSYCKTNNVLVNEDVPEDNFITTQRTDGLKVFNLEGLEIQGIGACIVGFDDDFQIDIFGIAYPFYGQEFPHHVTEYENSFK